MSYTATVIEVLIASPGDVAAERAVARDVILRWNQVHAQKDRLILLPRMWETDATPEMGADPQEIINEQLGKGCDLLVAIFWTKLGSPTPRAPSGTVEEITEHLNTNKPALVYFSQKAVPFGMPYGQRDDVEKFKAEIKAKGLLGEFGDEHDFRNQFRDALERTIHRFFSTAGLIPAPQENKPVRRTLSDKALAILSAGAKSVDKRFMQMPMVGGFRVWSGDAVLYHGSDAIGWTSAIQELVDAHACRDINGKRQIFELTQDGLDLLEEASRERFESGEVYVSATIRKSPTQLLRGTEQTLKYVMRFRRQAVENVGIEWNYDYILRDDDFRHLVCCPVKT